MSGTYSFSSTTFGPCSNKEHLVGEATFDGKGGLTGSETIYEASSPPAEGTGSFTGSYTVNSNGTGTITSQFCPRNAGTASRRSRPVRNGSNHKARRYL